MFGEALFEIMVEDGAVMLVEAASWEIKERAQWLYLAHFTTPEGDVHPDSISRPCATPAHRL